jgi:ubiquinol-cytochrome c reductase cytochrome b subunit
MKRVFDWLDHRTGYRGVMKAALDEPVPGGASFAYTFGSVLTFILILQMTTGIFLAMYYSPSATDAWGSVAYIQDEVTLGWFIRGLHSHGASAMVIVCGLHLLQTAVYGAYKAPRELNWILGVMMLGLILAFALTGYLLPWDQTGYWATKVATGIAGTSPVIGEQLQQAAQGGNEYGNLTLTRFFAIHVFILPALLIGLVVLHIALFRKHGVTPRWDHSEEHLEAKTQPFWPDQMFKDMVAIAVVFAAIVTYTVISGGASLDAPADPSSNFDARPEWYFRPLFQLLKYFEGPLEMLVALGTPVVVLVVLIGVPFVDRGPDRSPKKRAIYLAILGLGMAMSIALTLISVLEDRGDDKLQERLAAAEVRADTARELAKQRGVPSAGGVAVFGALDLWDEHCAVCHSGPAEDRKGPLITAGYNSRQWLRDFYKDPSGDEFFGVTKIKDMEPVEVEPGQLDALVELIYAETQADDVDPALVEQGSELFEGDPGCDNCHSLDGNETGDGPNLGGRGTVPWFASLIRDAGQPHLFGGFGDKNEMDRFDDSLSYDQRGTLARYLVWLRTASPDDIGVYRSAESQ